MPLSAHLVPPELSFWQRRRLRRHGREVQQSRRQVRLFLAFSLIFFALFPISPYLFRPISHFAQSPVEINETTQQKNIQIEIGLAKKYFVMADEFHFYNLIYNVIDNAVKYSENEAIIQISSKENNKGLQLNFSDKGVGIPANDLPFVFDKFFRVAREDSKDIEGFGIGLSYVKRVCEWHKWKVFATNNEDKGITISIQINKNDYE